MCWVMPPLSDRTTFDLRIRSSSEVLPWSTWPRIVMTGGRGTRFSDVPEDAKDVEQVVFGRALVDHLELDAELQGEHDRQLVVQGGVDGGELVHGHQLADQIVGLDADRLGEAADGDRRLDLGVRLARGGDGDPLAAA